MHYVCIMCAFCVPSVCALCCVRNLYAYCVPQLQVLQGLKQTLMSAGAWDAQAALVEPAALAKCTTLYQL